MFVHICTGSTAKTLPGILRPSSSSSNGAMRGAVRMSIYGESGWTNFFDCSSNTHGFKVGSQTSPVRLVGYFVFFNPFSKTPEIRATNQCALATIRRILFSRKSTRCSQRFSSSLSKAKAIFGVIGQLACTGFSKLARPGGRMPVAPSATYLLKKSMRSTNIPGG